MIILDIIAFIGIGLATWWVLDGFGVWDRIVPKDK
jgi:hypothetical protein